MDDFGFPTKLMRPHPLALPFLPAETCIDGISDLDIVATLAELPGVNLPQTGGRLLREILMDESTAE